MIVSIHDGLVRVGYRQQLWVPLAVCVVFGAAVRNKMGTL